MNAKELLEYFDLHARREWSAASHETILRALRLLAAAEGGEGTPEADALEQKMYQEGLQKSFRTEYLFDKFRDSERERNALAARVAELEPDAERYRWLRVQRHADIAACWYLPVLPQDYPVDTPEQRDIAIDAARSAP